MEIRVVVPEAVDAKELVQRLAGVIDATVVSLDSDNRTVRVRANRESRATVPHLLTTVALWLDETALDSTTVWLDDRQYGLSRSDARVASVA